MTTLTAEFKQHLANLNPAQRQAVETLDGPVMVFAGPGTGKTQVLTLRVANLIAQGLAEPEQILAVTFTNAAAVTMRQRLVKMIGSTALRVHFHTFHDFCQLVISEQPEVFPFGTGSKPLDDLEQIEILQNIIDQSDLAVLRPPGKHDYYLRAIIQAITKLKEENVSPETYDALVEQAQVRTQELFEAEQAKKHPSKTKMATWQKELDRQVDLKTIYRRYLDELKARARYDFADMILETVNVFRKYPDILAVYQEKFQYLLIDEYQDTNNSQDAIAAALASFWGEQANIFVVGDPFQSIYRFQGANLENFLSFARRYPSASVINLQTGYRCHDKTYALAHALSCEMTPLGEDWQPTGALQNYQKNTGSPALLTELPSREAELINIFVRIKKLLADGVKPEEITIIYRNNREATLMMDYASRYGVPFEIEGGQDVLATAIVEYLLDVAEFLRQLTHERASDAKLYKLLWHQSLSLDELAIIKLAQLCRERSESLLTVVLNKQHRFWKELERDGISTETAVAIQNVGEKLRHLCRTSQTQSAGATLQEVLNELGLLAWVRSQAESVKLLLELYSFLRRVSDWERSEANFDLEKMLDKISLMRQHNLKISLQDLNVHTGAISLTTAHKAKGREWAYVFIYGLNRGVWDETRGGVQIKLPEGILHEQAYDEQTAVADEEKRLFYVALTRAKVQNFLSFHTSETTDGNERTLQPADLVYWLQTQEQAGLVASAPALLDADGVNQQLETLLAPPPARNWSAATRDFLRARVAQLTMSATMLNDYLSDTQKFIEKHLLQAPQFEESVQLDFGNAMHRTLEQFLRPATSGGEALTLEQAQQIFMREWEANNVDEPDKSAWREIGLESVRLYCEQLQAAPAQVLAVERQFGTLVWHEIPLTGKIDRIDQTAPGEALVIDYKTGSQLSLNALLGKTTSVRLSEREASLPEAIRSPYKRQLLFYKLLCQLAPDFHENVNCGALHFVRQQQGKIVTRELELPEAELELLKDLIQTVWQEWQQLRFLDEPSPSLAR